MSHFLTELGRNSLQAATLAAAVLLVQWALGRHLQPRWRCALWLLVVVRLLVPFSLDSVTSLSNLPNLCLQFVTEVSPNSSSDTSPAVVTKIQPIPFSNITQDFHKSGTPMELISQPKLQAPAGIVTHGNHSTSKEDNSFVVEPYHSPSESAPQAALQFSAVFPSPHFPWSSVPAVIFWIWLSGTIVLLGNILIASVRIAIRSFSSETVTDESILSLMEECRESMNLPRGLVRAGKLRIIETTEVSSPALHGLLDPCLLLPKGFTKNFSHQELRFVFLHELAHLKRRDLLMNWIMAFLQSAHWFNPFVWLAFARWRNERELACDAMVLDAMGPSHNKEYGHTILRLLEEFNTSTGAPGMVGILEDKGQLRERISMIASYGPAPRSSLLAITLITLLSLVGLTDARSDTQAKAAAPTSNVTHDQSELALNLRDGSQVLGLSLDDSLRFHSASLGDLKLPVASINSLKFSADSNSTIVHLIATNGDELDVQFVDPTLHVKTGFGESEVPVAMIRDIKFTTPEQHSAENRAKSLSDLIQNPSFETPAITGGPTFMRFVTGPSNAGWTFINSAAIGLNGCGLNQYQQIGTTNGSQYVCLQGINGNGAAISQTMSNVPAGNYSFTFTASQRCTLGVYTDNTQNQTVTVFVDGTNVGSFTPADQNWYPYETTPISLGEGSHTLTFTNIPVQGDASILLDAIGIKEVKPSSALNELIPSSSPSKENAGNNFILELRDGSIILGKSLDEHLKFHSASLGDLNLPVASITSIKFSTVPNSDTVHVSATNGDELDLTFAVPDIQLQTTFGKSDVPVKLIRQIRISHREGARKSSSGLVGLWKGDDNGKDAIGTNNASVPSGVTYEINKQGKGFYFDGSVGGLNIPASPALNVGAGAGFTFSFWIQPISPTIGNPLIEWPQGTHFWVSGSARGVGGPGSLYANISDTSGQFHLIASPNGIIQAAIPQMVTLTYDKSSGVGSIYYNGKIVASQPLGTFSPKTDTPFAIGERTVPEEVHYQGIINEASIYNRALSPQEIQALYSAETLRTSVPQPALQTDSQTGSAPASSQNITTPSSYFGNRVPPTEVK